MFLRNRQRQRSSNWAPGGISWSNNAPGSPAGPLQVRHGPFKKGESPGQGSSPLRCSI